MAVWKYDKATKSFVDEFGRLMGEAELAEVRDHYLDSMSELLESYGKNLAEGRWPISQYEAEMRRRLKDAHIAEYVLGRGGVAQMTPSDYGKIGSTLKKQYKYLRRFLDDVEAGDETRGEANNRARNFLGAARQSFSQGRGKAYGLSLPAHPGDGGTSCHGNCRCHWDIVETKAEWKAYWRVSANKPCADCVARAIQWGPFVQKKKEAD